MSPKSHNLHLMGSHRTHVVDIQYTGVLDLFYKWRSEILQPRMEYFRSGGSRDEGPTFASANTMFGSIRSCKKVSSRKHSRGLVIFFHGVKQHSRSPEVLHAAVNVVEANNTTWYAWDMHGHGLSSKILDPLHPAPPLLVPDLDILIQDAIHFVELVARDSPHSPFILSGHSFGGGLCVSIASALQTSFGQRFRGIVLTAPLILQNLPMLSQETSLQLMFFHGLRCNAPAFWFALTFHRPLLACLARCAGKYFPPSPAAKLRESVGARAIPC